MADTPETAKLAEDQYRRIGGLLGVFFVAQLVATAKSAWELSELVPWLASLEFESLARSVPSLKQLVVCEILAQAVIVVGSVVGLVTTAPRSSHAPSLWRALLAFTLFASLLDWYAIQLLEPSLRDSAFQGELEAAGSESLVGAAITAFWLFYWLVSKRVAYTFSSGTTSPIASTPPKEPAPPPPQEPAPPPPQDPTPPDFFRGRARIHCPHCGAHVLATAEFCRSCKRPLADRFT